MRILAWNCRGTGKALIVRALKALEKENSPNIVFLAKTKSKVQKKKKK
jgi:predicted AAA+ superfamily ATPase